MENGIHKNGGIYNMSIIIHGKSAIPSSKTFVFAEVRIAVRAEVLAVLAVIHAERDQATAHPATEKEKMLGAIEKFSIQRHLVKA